MPSIVDGVSWSLGTTVEQVGDHTFVLWTASSHEAAAAEQRRQIDLSRAVHREHYANGCMFTVLWPVARALATVVDGLDLRDRRVLEIGCGLGLPSLVAARRGARVLATDHHPDALTLVERNAERNHVSVDTRLLDWASDTPQPDAEWILASDVLFAADCARSLPRFLSASLAKGGTALVADPCRAWHTEFEEESRKCGLSVDTTIVHDALITVLSRHGNQDLPTLRGGARRTAGSSGLFADLHDPLAASKDVGR